MTDQEKQQFFKNMKTFLALAKNELGIEKLPKIIWILDSDNTGQTSFGGFVLKTQAIRIVLKNRHPIDIMRTLAHELVHYKQWTENRLDATSGNDGSAEENEANAKAGVIMRQFNRGNPDSFSMKALSEGSKMIQAIDPKSLDSIYGIQAYDRDKKVLKKKKDAAADSVYSKNAIAKRKELMALNNDPSQTIQVYNMILPVPAVRKWRDTKDRKWALDYAKRWGGVKLTWPQEVVNDIHSDPEWEPTVIKLWDYAEMLLKLKGMPANIWPASGRNALDRIGADGDDLMATYYKLRNITKKVLAKHNIDRHGLRLPTLPAK